VSPLITFTGGRGERLPRGTFPPFIHFTLQKTNRETQDALAHLSRILHANVKDLSVAGTKDKRGVTVQRVSVKRGNKTVEDIWRMANGQNGRKSLDSAMKQRGERGVRVADLNYRKAGLELGMLKGNAFVITLRYFCASSGPLYNRFTSDFPHYRNVQVDSIETLDKAMNTVKHKGFINYYGRWNPCSFSTESQFSNYTRNATIRNSLRPYTFNWARHPSIRLAQSGVPYSSEATGGAS
jgi:tRNA pseudouridine13 synthase